MSARSSGAPKRKTASSASSRKVADAVTCLRRQLADSKRELKEAHEQQTAMAQILRVISASPTDIQPVLNAVAESAARLCDARDVIVRRVDGDVYRLVAHVGSMPVTPSLELAISRRTFMGRAIRERRTIHIHDVLEAHVREDYPESPGFFSREEPGYRTVLCAPLLRESAAIGVIIIRRPDVRPFSDKQIKLLEAFASQAVIAVENVRLFNETKEALEQQTVISEILRVISSSPTDVQPVFDAIVKSGVHLFGGMNLTMRLVRGEHSDMVASTLFSLDAAGEKPIPLDDESVPGSRAIRRRTVVQAPDAFAPEWAGTRLRERAEQRGFRAVLAAPLLREGNAIGAINVLRAAPGPFTDKEVALLETFASQAVIAIENVRLFKELQARNAEVTESLEQQTATADILKVISGSPTDVQPVFDAIVRSGVHLFGGLDVSLRLVKGEQSDIVASTRPMTAGTFPVPLGDDSYPSSRAMLRREVVHIPDIPAAEWVNARFRQRAEQRGFRSIAVAPLVRDNTAIGNINVNRATPGPFTDKQIALLKTFANQAVIAIENVRLLNETKEALERQTATAEILKVIASSPSDVQPVFDAIVETAKRLLGGFSATVTRIVDGMVHLAAFTGVGESGERALKSLFPAPLSERHHFARVVETKASYYVGDSETNPDVTAEWREMARQRGFRSVLFVPMLREGVSIGTINVTRREPGAFSDHQINLLQTFADQAVIAIENARLFNETKEALERQTATAEVLKVISSSPTDIQPVFDAVTQNAARLCGANDVVIRLLDGDVHHGVAHYGSIPMVGPLTLQGSIAGRAMLNRKALQIEDLLDPSVRAEFREADATAGRYRTFLAAPLVRKDIAIGAIVMRRVEVSPFTDKQIALLETFADQAVIAIENVRLFKELQARNAEVTEALEQQTATTEILRVISSSPTDIQPVLDAVAQSAARLCNTDDVYIRRIDKDSTQIVAHVGVAPLSAEGKVRPLQLRTLVGAVARECRTIHIPDITEPHVREKYSDSIAGRLGLRSLLYVPLLREGAAIGVIVMRRREVRPFTDKQIQLLETFAAQAVIAIENVRLFKELQARNAEVTEALEQQTATANILKVISASPTDTQPVFDAIVQSGIHLFQGTSVVLRLVKGDRVERVASAMSPTFSGTWDTADISSLPLYDRNFSGRAIMRREVVHVPDVFAEEWVDEEARSIAQRRGYRAIIAVPLLREEHAVGTIVVVRATPGSFSDKDLSLLRTFADQAVIAIENVRLFNEIQDKSRQLEVANKHKSDFLAHMSHELRTPLNAVIGFSEALIARMFGEVNAKQDEYLKDIHSSGQHLLSLINDILDLAKVEAGRMELELSEFHLPSALQNALTLVRERAQTHGIALKLTVDPKLDEIRADERKVKQIVLNLLSNAVKFTPDGGRVDVDAQMNDGSIEISVKDTGDGIAPEDQDTLFEEFRQVGRGHTRKHEGTGLGLALTRRFVELHGGRIWLESAPGKGSTFTFTLPLTTVTRD